MILETETKITKIDGIEEAHTMFRWSNSREFQFSNEINSIVTDEIIQKKRKNQTDNLKNWNLMLDLKNMVAFKLIEFCELTDSMIHRLFD